MAGQAETPTVMPMKLIASWDMERSNGATCVPRLCTLTLTHLESLRVLEPGLQRITIAVALKGSRHTLRSNDIEVSGNGLFSLKLQITFALQYPHFIKRDVNVLRVTLQRRKRYKTTPIPGYRTLAVGQVNLSEVIQHDVGSELFLYAPKNKVGEAEHVATVALGQLTSQAVDSMRHSQGMHHDLDSSDEEQEFYEPSDDDEAPQMAGMYDSRRPHRNGQEGTNPQRRPALNVLKGMAMKKLNGGKLFDNFRRRGKLNDAECEGDPEEEHEGEELEEEEFVGSDFLQSDEDVELSDSDFEIDPDTMSIQSTPKPILQPFYAPSTTSSSSASLRGPSSTVGDNSRGDEAQPAAPQGVVHPRNIRHRVEHIREKALKKEPKDIKEESVRLDRREHGGRDRQPRHSDSRDERLFSKELRDDRHPSKLQGSEGAHTNAGASEKIAIPLSSSTTAISTVSETLGLPSSTCDVSNPENGTPSKFRQRSFSALPSRRKLDQMAGLQRGSSSDYTLGGPRELPPEIDPETIVRLNDGAAVDRVASLLVGMPPSIILLNANDPHGVDLAQAMVESGMPVVITMNNEHVQSVMAAIMSKLQKYCSSHAGDPLLGICVVGSEGYTNTILQSFVKLITSKASIKVSFFRFFLVPLGVNRLATHLGNIDSRYRLLFQDSSWKEAFDSHDSSWEHMNIDLFSRINRYLSGASTTRQLPVAQALVNRAKPSGESDSGQVFVYFLNEVRVGTIDPNDILIGSDDTFRDGGTSDKTLPFSPSTIVANPLAANNADAKELNSTSQSPPMGQSISKEFSASSPLSIAPGSSGEREVIELALDYWPIGAVVSSTKKEKDSGKLSARTAVRCAWVTVLPTNFQGHASPPSAFTMVLVPKEKSKRALPFPLPRRSHARDKEKDAVENAYISKLVCSPKRSSTLKVYIDTVEWSDVKFFSLSQPGKTLYFPVAVFSSEAASTPATVQTPELNFSATSPLDSVDSSLCTMSDV